MGWSVCLFDLFGWFLVDGLGRLTTGCVWDLLVVLEFAVVWVVLLTILFVDLFVIVISVVWVFGCRFGGFWLLWVVFGGCLLG